MRMGLTSMLSAMFQRTGKWTAASLRLLRAVAEAPYGHRRLTLLQYANQENNEAAKIALLADKEISLVRYYGVTRYLYEKSILPVTSLTSILRTTIASESSQAKPSSSHASTGAKVPFMITKSMRADLEGLSYSADIIKQMTPIQANLVLQHALAPERYETEIDVLVVEADKANKATVKTKESDDVTSAPVAEHANETLSHGESSDVTTTAGGRLWYEVIEQPEGLDPFVLGLFLSESEARTCQKIYEELARKKGSRSMFATRATRRA